MNSLPLYVFFHTWCFRLAYYFLALCFHSTREPRFTAYQLNGIVWSPSFWTTCRMQRPFRARWMENLPWTIISLTLPFAGLGKTFGLLMSYTSVSGEDVEKAVSRGAVVIVSWSKDWESSTQQSQMVPVRLPAPLAQRLGLGSFFQHHSYTNVSIRSNNNGDIRVKYNVITPPSMQVSDYCYDFCGKLSLPWGYHWVFPDRDHMTNYSLLFADQRIPHSRSYLKMVTSFIQLFSSSITLYRTRGSQLDQYGYAAFGLSVFPYLLMSFVNLCCAIILGEYPYLYPLDAHFRAGSGLCRIRRLQRSRKAREWWDGHSRIAWRYVCTCKLADTVYW